MSRLLFSGSGRRDPPLHGLFIDTRLVSWILVLECMVSPAAHVCIGFGTQDLLQSSNGTGIWWMVLTPVYNWLFQLFGEVAGKLPSSSCPAGPRH